MALRMAMYSVQTLILVFREALATGAGSVVPFAPSEGGSGGVSNGRMVVRASGKRRVRKSVDDWRYVFETCDPDVRAEADEVRDDIEEDRTW